MLNSSIRSRLNSLYWVVCRYYMIYGYSVAAGSSSPSSSPSACSPAASLSTIPGQLRPLVIHYLPIVAPFGRPSSAEVCSLFFCFFFNNAAQLSFYLSPYSVCPKPVSVECRPGKMKPFPPFKFRRIWPVVQLLSMILWSSSWHPTVQLCAPGRQNICPSLQSLLRRTPQKRYKAAWCVFLKTDFMAKIK